MYSGQGEDGTEKGWSGVAGGRHKDFGKEILLALVVAIIALVFEIAKDFWRQHDTYENTLAAIAAEAQGNSEVLTNTFDAKKFSAHPVFRDLNTKVVDGAVSNNLFVQEATPELLSTLVLYANRMRQLNAHRGGLEKVYFAPSQDAARMQCYRTYFIAVLEHEAALGRRLTSAIADVRQNPPAAVARIAEAVEQWTARQSPDYKACPGS